MVATIRSKAVDSSVLATVGYDKQRRVLKVRFRNGRIYYYLDVSPAEHAALLASTSIGKYFNEVIKPQHRAVRVRAEPAK
ncbi:MAG: KTSC domain-containing protein [Acidobacteriota bacterium]|nr:KTSC domain-containing protein [Acidobacteriota bacterium]